MKVLHILASSKFSGAENVVCQIAELFRGSDIEIIYCSPDGPIRDTLKHRNVEFFPLKELSTHTLKNAIEKVSPVIIHAHDMRASFIASQVAGKTPIISHIHNNGFDSRKLSLKTLGFLWASRNISHIFWVSKGAYDDFYFKRFTEDKSSILPNIVDIDSLKEKAKKLDDAPTYDFVYLGRLEYPKNPMRFVEIVNLVRQRIPDVRVAIIGDGTQKNLTRAEINRYELEDNIKMLGFISNPYGILSQTKALVMTSFWEGTPMSSLEALSLGVPVISTPVDGLKEIITNNVNGLLSDSNEEIADFIVKILRDKALSETLSNNARITAERINNKQDYKNSILEQYIKLASSPK